MYLKKTLFVASISAALSLAPAHAVEINDRLEITGLIEFEAGYSKEDRAKSSSDLSAATAELGINGKINDWVSANVLFLFEDGGDEDDTFEIDEAIIHIGNEDKSSFYVDLGRQYVPFGNFESLMISDPLTLDLGETRESGATIGFGAKNGVYGNFSIFNGDTDNADNNIEHFVANLGIAKKFGDNSIDFGVSYINSIADSNLLSEEIVGAGTNLNTIDKVKGIGFHAIANLGAFTIIGEHIKAQDDILGTGTKAKASNIEIGYNFTIRGKDTTFGIAYGKTKEADAFGLPEKRVLATLSSEILKNTTLGLEIGQETDYAGVDTDIATLQLAVEF